MRDIVITVKRIRIELITYLLCFSISFLSNVWAVYYYKSPISELLSSLFYVFIFSVVIYVLWSIVRIIISTLIKVVHRMKRKIALKKIQNQNNSEC